MKVDIGNYVDSITVYTFTDKLIFLGIPEEKCMWLGEVLSEVDWIQSSLEWYNEKRKRKVKIKIHPYDVWSMDHTLALIVAPMLKQLQQQKHGSAMVDDKDLPDEYLTQDIHAQWDWVLNEITEVFEIIAQEDFDMYDNDQRKRVENGLRLFGRYYFALWD